MKPAILHACRHLLILAICFKISEAQTIIEKLTEEAKKLLDSSKNLLYQINDLSKSVDAVENSIVDESSFAFSEYLNNDKEIIKIKV